jgi:tetratricopeptide (TPR) repeat protein
MSSAQDPGAAGEADWDLLREAAVIADLTADECVDAGLAHALTGSMAQAAVSFQAALARQQNHPRAMMLLGPALVALGRNAEALAHADRALALAPSPEAWITRGDALHGLQDYEAALASYLEAAKSETRRPEALAKAASQQFILRRYDLARAAFDQSLALRPQDATVQFDRALLRLTLGDFEGGWRDYEARLRKPRFLKDSSGPLTAAVVAQLERNLRPDHLAGQRVLVVAEQGIGDMVMFASLFADLLAAGAEVTCVCDGRLVRLFAASFPGMRVLDPAAALRRSDFDKVVDFGELARLFRGRREDFPGRPYLTASEPVRSRWAQRLGPPPPGLRIGLSWRGGAKDVARRSLTLDQLLPVLDLPGCEFVSLQYGEVEAEVAAASARLDRPIRVFPKAEIDDFEELAGLIAGLDVVVSVQNSVVHLTGALGQDCQVLLPYNPEWRYMAEGPAMPWYASVTLHRQAAPGAWQPVVRAVTKALASRLAA